jgi:hypothetical protein
MQSSLDIIAKNIRREARKELREENKRIQAEKTTLENALRVLAQGKTSEDLVRETGITSEMIELIQKL